MKLKLLFLVLIVINSCKETDNDAPTEPDNSPMPAAVAGLSLSISNSSFDDTYSTLRNTIAANPNISIVAEVNHTMNAASVGLELAPARIIFFGNPNLGTPLMQDNQLAGLDLPQKILAYQDSSSDVYLGFNSTNYLKNRHQLGDVATLPTINTALTNITTSTSGGELIISSNATVISGGNIITKTSTQDFEATYNTLKTAVDNNSNLRIIAEVNHQQNAIDAGLDLRPTRLIIFGNPNLGSPLMQDKLTTAIDLPQKMLVWEDELGTIKVSYNSPSLLKQRHELQSNDNVLETITMALDNLSNTAAGI